MNNKKKIWIIGSLITILVLVILGTTMANTIFIKLAPDKYVLLSMLEMKKLSEKENKSYPKNRKTSFDLNLKELNGVGNDYYKEIIEGSGLSLSIANNAPGDIIFDTGFKKHGSNLINLSVYSSNNKLGIKIPGLLDQYVMVDLTQFKPQYDQSGLSAYFGDIKQDDVDILNGSINLMNASINGGVMGADTKLNSDIEELIIDLAKNIRIKHIGSTNIMIDHKQKKANKFSGTVDAEYLKGFIKNVTAVIVQNINLKHSLAAYENYFKTDDLENGIYDAIEKIAFSDIEMTYVIDKNKHIVGTELLTSIGVGEEKVNIKSNCFLSGGSNLFDAADINLILESENRKMQFAFEKDLDAKEDNFALTSSLMMGDGNKINFNLSGNFLVNQDTKDTNFDMNKIEFKSEEYGQEFSLLGSGSFKVQDLKDESIILSDVQQLDLFSIGPIQMLGLIKRIGSQFYGIGNMLGVI